MYALRPYRGYFLLMCACIVMANVGAASVPYFLKIIADTISTGATGAFTISDFSTPLILIASVLVGHELLFRAGHILETYVIVRIFDDVTSAVYDVLLSRPAAYFEDAFSGEMARRVEQVGASVREFVQHYPWELGWVIISSITTGVLLSTVHPLLIAVFIVWLAIFLTFSSILLSWQFRTSQNVAEAHASLSGTIVDALSNINLVRSFAAHEYERSYYRTYIDNTVAAETRDRWIGIANRSQQGLSLAILGIALVYTAVYLFTRNALTIGDFVIIAAALPMMTSVIWNFGDIILRVIRQYGECKNALEALEIREKPVEEGSRVLGPGSDITFDSITFSYPGVEARVFERFTLTLKKGERVGVVGKSGVGKSTLVKLLLRYYDPQGGEILIGGERIATLTFKSLRDAIAFVPQDTALFHRTIYENILYARPSASRDEVVDAGMRAYAHDFIMQLPHGYDTRVGERGIKLSGGERQRIALARAILKKDAPILVLDEATSALDSESEQVVQKGLQGLFEGRTVLAIAHRLSTLRAMDRIIVLENGAIAEDGSPQELLATEGGMFKAMWEHQKNGFVE